MKSKLKHFCDVCRKFVDATTRNPQDKEGKVTYTEVECGKCKHIIYHAKEEHN